MKSAYQPNVQKASRNYPLVTLFGILNEPWSLTPKYSYMPYTQVLFETYTLETPFWGDTHFADVFMMLTKLHSRQHTKFYLLKITVIINCVDTPSLCLISFRCSFIIGPQKWCSKVWDRLHNNFVKHELSRKLPCRGIQLCIFVPLFHN